MKKILCIMAIVITGMILLKGSVLALHTQDAQGRRCARCHSTHQGISQVLLNPHTGDVDLAEKFGEVTISTSCLACHDGTQSRGVTGGNAATMMRSGVFDLTGLTAGNWPGTHDNYSAHQVDFISAKAVPVTQAPGNKNLYHYGTHNDAPLSCASCHNPHGAFGKTGISHAYLQPNPNRVISGKFESKNPDWGNQWDEKNYTEVILTRVGNTNVYENAATAPWLSSYVFGRNEVATHYVRYPVAVQIGGEWVFSRRPTAVTTLNFTVNAFEGKVRFDAAITDPGVNQLTARVFLPILVRVTGTFNGTILDKDGNQMALNGIRIFSPSINQWCGACHGHYNIASKGDGYSIDDEHFYGHSITTRPWAQSYATPISSDGRMNCMSCHFAHGTRSDLMLDSNKQLMTGTTLTDNVPANKRYFGGSVCVRCHTSSHNEFFMMDNKDRPANAQWR